jgi:uncharacterized protein YaaQ
VVFVGTYQRRKTTLLEQIKEGRPHCWNRSKKEDHIVGTDQRRKTTLSEQIKEVTNCNTHTCISSSVTPKSADNYIAVYIGVGAFVVTALVAVIVVATLR